MLYTVIDVSKKLSISRQAVYKKLEKMVELKPHIKVKNNVKYIDEEGLELIRVSMDDNLTGIQASNDAPQSASNDCDNEHSTKLSGSHDTRRYTELCGKSEPGILSWNFLFSSKNQEDTHDSYRQPYRRSSRKSRSL